MLSQATTLVGREREQEQLNELLAAACAGNGQLAMVSGEAGIGKTTLVRDLVGRAREQGALVLSGACYDLTTTPPYGPWTEAISGYQPSGAQPLPPSWFGNPEEFSKIGSQPVLLEETRGFFAVLAGYQPLVIVLEDMHWADPASVEALRFLARTASEMSALLVATNRDDEMTGGSALYEMIPTLVREAGAERIELRRWGRPETQQLIEGEYGLSRGDSIRLTDYVQALAEGNPFYTHELLRTLEADRVLQPGEGGWTLADLAGPQVPPLVRQVIEGRLDRLSVPTRELLEIASVIDYAVSFDLWQEVGGAGDEQLAAAVDEALNAQLVDELSDRSGIQFRHALVRETLHAGINGLRLRSLHRQTAETLIEHPSPDPDRVAHHLDQAGDERQIDWLIRAAERAERSYALTTAAERFEQAATLLKGDEDRLQDRGWLLYRISSILRWSGLPWPLQCAEEAIEIGRQIGDPWLTALATYDRAFHYFREGGRYAQEGSRAFVSGCLEFDHLLRASEDVDDDSSWRRLLELRPFVAVMRRLAIDSDPEDVPYITDMWGAAAASICEEGRLAEARSICEQMRPLAEAALRGKFEVPESAGYGDLTNSHSVGYGDLLNVLGRAYAYLGMPIESSECFRKALDYYKIQRHFVMVVNNNDLDLDLRSLTYDTEDRGAHHAMAAEIASHTIKGGDAVPPERHVSPATIRLKIIEGCWQEAREIAQADGHGARFQERKEVLLGMLDLYQGDLSRLRDRIVEILPAGPEEEPGIHHFQSALDTHRLGATLAIAGSDRDAACRWLKANDRWLVLTESVLGRVENRLAWAEFHLDGGDLAEARVAGLQALEEASEPRQPLGLIAVGRFLGELETGERNYEQAEERLAEALRLAERCQAPYEIALTRLVQAELAAATRDLPRAQGLLRRARETFERLEARPALNRAARLKASLAGLAREYPAGLTAREVEVLCLVAEGLSNNEIADRLYLSVRTVERHLTNIYRKIGVNNRVEASSFVQHHQLAIPPAN